MLKIAKTIAKAVAPGAFYSLKRVQRRNAFRTAHGGAEYRATLALSAKYGKSILGGPFRGTKYGDDVACSAYVAKLVGSYEEELHESIEQAIARGYTTVVDIGSAEGYYAVGMAVRLPQCQVHAFDIDPEAAWYCQSLAKLNGVADRVQVRGFCGPEELQQLSGLQTLVICDCEGFEDKLLDPAQVPGLAVTDVIVELHDCIVPGLTARLLARFSETHHIQLFDTRERDPARYPILEPVAIADRPWAVREGRGADMQWAVMIAKQKVSQSAQAPSEHSAGV